MLMTWTDGSPVVIHEAITSNTSELVVRPSSSRLFVFSVQGRVEKQNARQWMTEAWKG